MKVLPDIGFNLTFSHEYLKMAMAVSLLSVWVLVGVFYYLNRYTKRRYFSIWTVAWLFYALWLTLCLAWRADPERGLALMLKQWCISVAATFLLWGSMRFLARLVRQRLLVLFMAFLLVWSYISASLLENPLQVQAPIFVLIGLASGITAWGFYLYRRNRQFIGAGLLSFGFLLWGVYLGGYPFLQVSPDLTTAGFFISTVLQLFIAVSMIILVLEQVRFANQRRAVQEIRRKELERQRLQTQVISTEERYRRLFERASEAIVIGSAQDLRLLELNQAALSLLGIERKEADNYSLIAFCQVPSSTDPAPQTGQDWWNLLSVQRPLHLVRKDGTIMPTEMHGSLIDFEGTPAYQFFFREVTDRSRLEQQLRHAEKLSSLGQMISGVTHELNNALTVSKGFLEVALSRGQWTPRTKNELEKAVQECNRAVRLVQSFLALAREQPNQCEQLDINELVQRVADLRKFGLMVAGVELKMDLDPALPATFANQDQFQQVLINLLNNALHAASGREGNGCIRIATRHNEHHIQVVVEDNGPGVPPHLRQKIFEPFFTTKPVGVGTGLGLSIAHSVLTEHHGRIYYETSSLGGAGFVVELPIESRPPIRELPEAVDPHIARPTVPIVSA
jgi:PAS domain S-box-containing protein